jgi:hypothetical protein
MFTKIMKAPLRFICRPSVNSANIDTLGTVLASCMHQ